MRMPAMTAVAGLLALAAGGAAALADGGVLRPQGEALLSAQDDLASIELWAMPGPGELDLLGRFEAVLEVRADASVRVDRWSIADALGESMLVTVVESEPLENRSALGGELGGWFGRYALLVEPLVEGEVELGPLRLVYLIDPDREANPTQLEAERRVLQSEGLALVVRGPGGVVVDRPAGAKGALDAERPFEWRHVLIAGVAMGVIGPVLAAGLLAARATRRQSRDGAPAACIETLDALERVIGAATGSELGVNGSALAGEALGAVRVMLDSVFGLGTRAQSGTEMVACPRLRSVLSADACDRLGVLVEASERARFAGAAMSADEARAMLEAARAVARGVDSQRRVMA